MSELKIVDSTRDRYHSLAISSVWDLKQIRNARVLVVGCGALGNEVCKSLAMMGVKTIAVVDRDTVELANLSRSVFFREEDHGKLKTDVIAGRLRELNRDVEVLVLSGDLDMQLSHGLVRRMDVVISCLDSRMARRSVNRLCGKVGKAWVDGAMEDLLGEVAVYGPGDGPCYECSLSEEEKVRIAEAASCRGIALRTLSLGKVPTTPTMGSIVGALQVQEAVKLLNGSKGSLAGKRLTINCMMNDFYTTSPSRNPECDGHDRFGEITEVPEFTAAATSARALLEKFKTATGEDGFLELGREIAIEFDCAGCGLVELSGKPIAAVNEESMTCPACGATRELKTSHVVQAQDKQADWPLAQLSVPRLEVLEVRGLQSVRWYELTGDCDEFGLANAMEIEKEAVLSSAD
jgi:adenylyltransferase/sulfurtransferase